MKSAKDDWKKGKVSGTVYSGEDKLTELMAKVKSEFLKRFLKILLKITNVKNICSKLLYR